MNETPVVLQTKSHYQILDGLRGVAALIVVMFHTCEVYSNGNHSKQVLNHGYLAVDFFFLLSGFVVAYAYDDRWGKMSQWDFYKRRLIRLQPMVIMGSVNGASLLFPDRACVFAGQFDASMEDAAGDAGRLHTFAAASVHGYPRMERDAPARWTRMVPLLRVHRKHPLRCWHSQALQ